MPDRSAHVPSLARYQGLPTPALKHHLLLSQKNQLNSPGNFVICNLLKTRLVVGSEPTSIPTSQAMVIGL